MIHTKRRYCITTVNTPEELHTWLVDSPMTLCTGFRLRETLWLNDSFSENGAQEYAVIQHGRQIESITVSWCRPDKLLDFIVDFHENEVVGVDFGPVAVHIEMPEAHGRCPLCA